MKLIYLASIAIASLISFIGCSGEDSHAAPPSDQLQSKLKSKIPPYLAIVEFKTEVIPVAGDQVKINFKATVRANEDLHEPDGYLEVGEQSYYVLKRCQSSGDETLLYGSIFAVRRVDNWDISDPEISSGLDGIGRPKKVFDDINSKDKNLIEGSETYRKLLKDSDPASVKRIKFPD